MSTFVTVNTSASTSVLIPFTSSGVAALAQTAIGGVNTLANINAAAYFTPGATVSGGVTAPSSIGSALILGVAQTNNNAINYGVLNSKYQVMINGAVANATAAGGAGTAVLVGGAQTDIYSGANAITVAINQNPNANAFLGGGRSVLANAFSFASLNVQMDAAPGTVLGGSTLIIDDNIGGGATVNAWGNDLVAMNTGGADVFIGNAGTNVVLPAAGTGTAHGTATITSTGAGNTLWVGNQGAPIFVIPNGGDAFLFNGTGGGSEQSATLFGGTKVINGQTIVAGANTGRVTVAGMNGYLEAGSAGGSVLQSGTTAGAATLVAGGQGDVLLGQAASDVLDLGNASLATAASFATGGAVTFKFGAGSGRALGLGSVAGNQFLFAGAGSYTIAGGHNASLVGSLYRDVATAGGAGNITIQDFVAQPASFNTVPGAPTFDRFDLNGKTVSSLTSTVTGGGTQATATLSDGTVINFQNLGNMVHQVGTFLQ